MGGGLGGGSSDAATTLIALNALWQCHLSQKKLQELAVKLGADVPFFVFGQNAFQPNKSLCCILELEAQNLLGHRGHLRMLLHRRLIPTRHFSPWR